MALLQVMTQDAKLPSETRPVRVVIADDAPAVRRGLNDLLCEISGVQVVAQTEDAPQTIAAIQTHSPDVVVLDFRMPGGGGLAVLEAIKGISPKPVVIVLTNYPEPAYRESCLAAGADYFLDKSTQFSLVPDIIRELACAAHAQIGFGAPVQPARILVADDSPTMRRMVISILQSLPAVEFDQAGSGLEAIERLALAPVKLVVLDLNMPDMHGFEVLRFVRQHQAYKDLPILVLTTRGDEPSKTEALALGASAYITKPFSPQELLDCARKLLSES